MGSKYVQLTDLSVSNDLFASMTFLVSRGTWTDNNPISGDIFTSLSSYGIRYNELSNNLIHSIIQTDGVNIAKAGNRTSWNFATNGGLRVASIGPLSSIRENTDSSPDLNAAINFETCRALSSEAWYEVHRRCFDACRAREMSGVVNRMLMEKGRIGINRFGMMAIVYDILNRHWLASDYFKRTNVLTCAHEINKERIEVTIKSAGEVGIDSPLYNLCEFKCWSTFPFSYYNPNTMPIEIFKVGTTKSLSVFSKSCFTYKGVPIPYSIIDTLDELYDMKMNIDMSIYDQNRFSSLSGAGYKGDVSSFDAVVSGHSFNDIKYRTLKTAFMPDNLPARDTRLSTISNLASYGPSYMGNIYLYPVFEPYEMPLWDYWATNAEANFVYQSEPNPCGSKTVYTTISSTYGNDILFNPQQALWEYHRYYKMLLRQSGQSEEDAEKNALPGDMIHFFEKLCRVQIYFKAKHEIPTNAAINIRYDLPPRPYMLSPSRRGEKHTFSVTYGHNAIDNLTMRTNQIEIAGNEPTLFQFSHNEDAEDSEWLIWIDAMWVW